jgi:hypothetical protein
MNGEISFVDRTLLETWASMKSLRPQDRHDPPGELNARARPTPRLRTTRACSCAGAWGTWAKLRVMRLYVGYTRSSGYNETCPLYGYQKTKASAP